MKCPNCQEKLPAGAYIFNYYKCKNCGGVIVAKRWASIFTALMAIVVGKLIFSKNYVFALVLTLGYFSVLFWKRSKLLEVRFEKDQEKN